MRPIPQEKCDRIRRLCQVHDQRTVAEIVGVTEAQVSRLKKRGWRAGGTKPIRPRPSDFVIQAQHMSLRELEKHYGAGGPTVRRWAAEVGREHRYFNPPKLPVPTREEIAQAIRERGVTAAHEAFGTSRRTMLKWRKARDMPYRGKPLSPAKSIGWVERYVAEARA